MEEMYPIRLFPTLPVLEQSLTQAGWECEMHIFDEKQSYRGVRLYHRQQSLQKDVLYLLRPTETTFPFDSYSYLSSVHHPGKANHLVCPARPDEEIMDQLMEIFAQLWAWEESIDLLVYRNASLQELCELGAELLENPVCIHDDWFVMMAITPAFAEIMEPEYIMSSAKGFVPRVVVDDFRYDSDYLETYTHHGAQLWLPPEYDRRSLYVNLWDGPIYKGRLLVAPKNRDFLCRDFLLAEALAQRALLLLRRKQLGTMDIHQNMDDIVFALLHGKQPEQNAKAQLLGMLRWHPNDRFLCLRLRPQQSSESMAAHMLHSDLFRIFPDSYILLVGQEQCVVLNLTNREESPMEIRHKVAPLCRDYCLYGGISSPVTGIRELQAAYYQSGAALDHAFRMQNERWIVAFSQCAMEHVLQNLPTPLAPGHLVMPELLELMDYDREQGTAYFDTLREYLIHERDIPRTSQALIIHRTTLIYRLKKIQSVMNVNLEDPWVRLYLMTSLWILDQQKQ